MPAKPSDQSETPPSAAGSGSQTRSLSGLLRGLVASRMRMMLAGGIVSLLIVSVVVMALVVGSGKSTEEIITSEMAMEALAAGKLADAARFARDLEKSGRLSTDEWGGPVFVLGVLAAQDAENANDKARIEKYRFAARYLQDAYNRGFPSGRDAEGMYLLGKSLYMSNQLSAARPILQAALKINPSRQSEIHCWLADTCLREVPPALEQALVENTKYVSDAAMDDDTRCEALLQRAQILFRLGQLPECTATLDKIPAHLGRRGEAAVLRGRILCREAQAIKSKPNAPKDARQKADEKYRAAMEIFRLAQGQDTVSNRATRQAMYLIGQCLVELGDDKAALAQFSRTGKLFADTPEGVAAVLGEAEAARRLSRDATAMAAYQRVLSAMADPQQPSNPWISPPELRGALTAAYQDYITAGKYELALQLTRHLTPTFSSVKALEMRVNAYRTWGQSLLTQAEPLPPDRAQPIRRQARAQFRRAAGIYAQLAQLEFSTRQYPERIWSSGMAYVAGQDYSNAARMFELYLKYESRPHRPQCLVELGDTYLALARCDEALQCLQECIDQHPRDVAAYRARLLASKAAAAKGDGKQAEAFLEENLNGSQLAPTSKEWRESLFALGELLFNEGRYADAASRLDEAVTRYPNAPQVVQTRYLAAEASHRRALELREALAKDVSDAKRAEHAARSRQFMESALAGYQAIDTYLSTRDPREMGTLDKMILRNSRFAVGEVYLELGQYDAAIQAYTTVANRYQKTPEVLDAYVQIANAYRRLNRRAEAQTSIEQARVALRRLPRDADFGQTTNYDRKQWDNTLNWMSSL